LSETIGNTAFLAELATVQHASAFLFNLFDEEQLAQSGIAGGKINLCKRHCLHYCGIGFTSQEILEERY